MIPYNNMNLVAIIDVLFHSELIDGTLREFTNFKFRLDFETTSTTKTNNPPSIKLATRCYFIIT